MAKSCGIHIGSHRYEIVVLDGGPKKHRIVGWKAAEWENPGEDGQGPSRADQLKASLAEVKAPRDNARLVVDSGLAAFRRVTVPFSEPAKIAQVLKFEVESELPQFNIADVVIDSLTQNSTDEQAELLCTAVPKAELQKVIDLCEKGGLEPLDAELETTSILNVALSQGLCTIEDAQLLVHVGDQSTAVVVVDAGEVREMRVIHLGAYSHTSEGDDSAEEGISSPARRLERAVARIRRELGRTVTAARTIHPISAIHMAGFELPGLVGSTIQDAPVYVLDCFDEESGEPADKKGHLVAAYGGALAGIDAAAHPGSLRREELRYTGTWERLEFPLAIATMLIATLLGVINILQHRELSALERNGANWYLRSVNARVFGDLKAGKRGYLSPVPDAKQDPFLAGFKARFDALEPDWEGDQYDALGSLSSHLASKNRDLEKRLGTVTDFPQPQSAFTAATLVLSVLEENMAEWRPSLRRIEGVYQPGKATSDAPETVKVTLDVVFFAEDTVEASNDLSNFLSELAKKPWHVEHQERSAKDLSNGKGVLVEGLPITVNVDTWLKSGSAQGNGGPTQ